MHKQLLRILLRGIFYLTLETRRSKVLTIHTQRITFFPTQERAAALADALNADDPDTEYAVVYADGGYFVAVFEDGQQVFTL
jgi:hypothetical protein